MQPVVKHAESRFNTIDPEMCLAKSANKPEPYSSDQNYTGCSVTSVFLYYRGREPMALLVTAYGSQTILS